MKIIEMLYQNRRDFTAMFECEGCGNKQKSDGYDDRNFHDNVIPAFKCSKCGKSRNDLNIISEPTQTKYVEGYQI